MMCGLAYTQNPIYSEIQGPSDSIFDLLHCQLIKSSAPFNEFMMLVCGHRLDVCKRLMFEPRDSRHLNFVITSPILRCQRYCDADGPWRVAVLTGKNYHGPHFSRESKINQVNLTRLRYHR